MTNPLALIIEDNRQLADIFARALQNAQFETEIIGEGNTAVERLKVVTPEVVVLDLHLPEVSGADILRQIRSDSRLEKTRVIITTADPVSADILRPQSDLVLIKPISFSQLRELASRLHPSYRH